MSYAKMMRRTRGKNKIRYPKGGCTYDIQAKPTNRIPDTVDYVKPDMTPIEKALSEITGISDLSQIYEKPQPFWCNKVEILGKTVYYRKYSPCRGFGSSISYFIES